MSLDRGNYRIQKFSGDGTWLASWGSQGSGNGQFRSGLGHFCRSGGQCLCHR